jgi:hypothetical protein
MSACLERIWNRLWQLGQCIELKAAKHLSTNGPNEPAEAETADHQDEAVNGERTEKSAEGAAEEQAVEELTDRQRLILVTMLENEITSERRRNTRPHVVRLINRTHKPSSYNQDFAGLATRRYVQSREGRNGGVWLTPTGRAEAQRLRSSS